MGCGSSKQKCFCFQISKQFPNMPNLIEFERRQDFNFYNGHHTLGMVLPLLPNQIEVGGMHLRPAKPLPKVRNHIFSEAHPNWAEEMTSRRKVQQRNACIYVFFIKNSCFRNTCVPTLGHAANITTNPGNLTVWTPLNFFFLTISNVHWQGNFIIFE